MKAIHSLFLALVLPGAGLAQDIEPQTAWPAFKMTNPGAWKVEWNPATELTFGHSLGAVLGKYKFR